MTTSKSVSLRGAKRSKSSNASRVRRAFFEALEPRSLLATITGGTGPGGVELVNGTSELEIWLDATDINANGTATSNGAAVTNWQDKSGNDRDFDDVIATPTYVASSTHGQPAVGFNGANALRTGTAPDDNPRNFIDGNGAFTIISVARYSGGTQGRVITAKTGHNWLFGFHGGSTNRNGHYDGWGSLDPAPVGFSSDTNWHLHMNAMNVTNVASNPLGDWYRDGLLITNDSSGTGDAFVNNVPDGLSLGAWNGLGESSTAEVSELMFYNRVLNDAELKIIENYLNAKYGVTPTLDVYAGDTAGNGDYDRDVFGIGRVDASNQTLSSGQSGFGIETAALDNGDYVLAGHKVATNAFTTSGIPAGVARRWTRAFYVDVTDANDNVSGTLAFDYSDAGVAIGAASTFKLLRSLDGGVNWIDVGATATLTAPDTVKFNVSSAQLSTGLYTLGDSAGPILAATPGNTSYSIATAPVIVDGGFTVTAGGSPTMTGSTVSINGFVNGNSDILNFTPVGAITGAYNNTTGVLTLSGNDTAANYQLALRSVTFSKANFEATPTRTLTFQVTDQAALSGSATRGMVINSTAASTSIAWDGGASPNLDWTNPVNWVGDIVPDANDVAVFSGTVPGAVNVPTNVIVGSISFTTSGGAYSINSTGGGISLSIGAVTQSGTTSNSITAPLTILSPSPGITYDVAASTTLTMSGGVAGPGNVDKIGAGTLVLSGNNTYTGATNANVGTLKVVGNLPAVPINLSNTAGGLNIADAAHVVSSSQYTPDGRLSYHVSDWSGQVGTFPVGQANNGPGNNMWLSNGTTGAGTSIAWNLGSAYNIGSAQIWNYNEASPWIGRGVKQFDLQIAATAPPEFGGAGVWTTVQAAVDWSNTSLYQGTGVNTYAGFNFTWAAPFNTQYVRFNNTLNYGSADAYTGLSEVIFITQGAGAGNPIPDASPLTVAGGAFLDLSGTNETVGSLAGAGTVTHTASGTAGLTTGVNNTSTTFSGVLQNGAGTMTLTKVGTGTQTISGVNTYTGPTSIQSGVLQLAVGADRLNPATVVTIGNAGFGGTLDLNNQNQTIGGLNSSGAGVNRVVDSTNDATFPVLTVNQSTSSSTYNGILGNTNQDGFHLVKNGSATLTLGGANTFTGKTSVLGGVLSISSDANLGTAPGAFVADQITIANGAVLQGTAVFTVNGNRGITLGAGGGSLGSTSGMTVAGRFTGGTGLAKVGTGDVILTNAAAGTAPGTININAGRLFFDSQNALGTTQVNINNGGTLDYLGGAALILANPVTIASGGNIASRNAQLTSNATLPTTGSLLINQDDNNTNTVLLTSNIALTGDLTIQVGGGGGNGGVGRLDGLISNNFNLTKTQTGVLHLNNGGNSFGGAVNVTAGTVRVTQNGALGTIAGATNVSSGATLEFNGAFNYTNAEPIRIAGAGFNGVGAVNKVGGAGSVDTLFLLTADASIGSGTVGALFTINPDINLGYGHLTFVGAGDTRVNGKLGASFATNSLANLNALPTGDYSFTAASQTFNAHVDQLSGTGWLMVGRGRQGWQFDTDGQGALASVSQQAAPGTDFSVFTPAAYSDAIVNDLLAQSAINNTGIEVRLKRAANLAGTAFQEVRWQNFPTTNFTMMFSNNITDNNSGFISPITTQIQASALGGAVTYGANTGDAGGNDYSRVFTWPWSGHASQRGFSYGSSIGLASGPVNTNFLWESGGENHEIPYTEIYIRSLATAPVGGNQIIMNGAGTVTLTNSNTYAGATTVNSGRLVVANAGALGTTGAGTLVNAGATLALQDISGPVTLANEAVTLNGAVGAPAVLGNVSGNNIVAASVPIVATGAMAVDSSANLLTVNANVDMRLSSVTFSGAGDVMMNGVLASTQAGFVNPSMKDYLVGNPSAGLNGFNPLAFWEFNEGSGAVAQDSTYRNNDGVFQGAATRGTGWSGLAGDTSLNVVAGGSVNVPVTTQFNSIATNNQVTLGFWSKVDPGQNPRNNTTFQALGSGGQRVAFTHAPWGPGDGRTYWDAGQGERINTVPHTADYDAYYEDGWHWWVMTKNSAGASQKIYRDGVEVATGAGGQTFINIASILIAPDHRGDLDDIFLVDTAMSGAQVLAMWNARTGLGAADNRVIKIGTGNATLTAANTYAGSTTVTGGTLIAANANALGGLTAGTSVASGATLGLSGGVTLANEPLTIDGLGAAGRPGALIGVSGNNTISAATPINIVSTSAGNVGLGSIDDPLTAFVDTFTINAPLDVFFNVLTVDGSGDTVLNGNVSATTTFSSASLSNLDNFATGDYSVTAASQTFTGHVETFGGESWLLVGRGRENWAWNDAGLGSVNTVKDNLGTPSAFTPNYYSSAIINDLMTTSGANLTNTEIRIKRAANTTGTAYQEDRWLSTSQTNWDWLFNDAFQMAVTHSIVAGPFGTEAAHAANTHDEGGNDWRRIFTWAWGGHLNQQGFSYGSTIDSGADSPTNFWWEGNNQAHAIPYTEVYIRRIATNPIVPDNRLIKNGAGSLTLAGSNTFANGTTVNAGRLLANNTAGSATGAGAVVVNNAGVLGGTGSIAGNVTLNNSAVLSPGTNTQVEDLTIGGSLSFANTSSLYAQVAGSVAGTGYDQVIVNGGVTIAPTATLGGVTNVSQAGGTNFTLINKTSAGAIAGNFANAIPPSPPASVSLGVRAYNFDYAAGVGANDLVLTAITSTLTWDGLKDDTTTSGNNNWTNPLNWVGDVAPVVGDSLIFSGVGVVNRNSPNNDYPAASTFQIGVTNATGSYTFGGNSISLIGTGLTQSGVATNTVGLALTGAGAVTISAGTLVANGANTNVGAVTVGPGVLGGTGSFTSAVAINAGGSVSPGSPTTAVGTLTVGSITFNGGTYAADLIGNTFDQIVSGGAINLNGGSPAAFTPTISGVQTAGSVYTFISNTAAGALAGAPFTGKAEGSSVVVSGGQLAYYSYVGGAGGNDFTLVVDGTPAVINGDGAGNNFIIREVDLGGGNTSVQTLRDGVIVDSRPTAALAGDTLTINGLGNNDTLLVDYAASGGLFNVNIVFNGGEDPGDNDSLAIADAPGNAHTITHTYLTAPLPPWSGTIAIDDDGVGGADRTISYTGLEPVTDNMSAVNRVFVFTDPGAETITLQNSGPNAQIQSTAGENTIFVKPTDSVTINLGGGVDTLNLLATTLTGNFTVTGAGNDDIVNVPANVTLSAGASLPGAASITGVQNINFTGGTLTAVTTATLTATGAITTNGPANDVAAVNVALTAGTGVGSAVNPINTVVANLEAGTATGGVFISNTGSLAIGNTSAGLNGVDVTGASGDISLVTTGSITIALANENVTGPGNITLNAQGAASDINTSENSAGSVIGLGAAALVTLTAGRDVNIGAVTGYGDSVSAGGILVTAGRDFVLRQDSFLDAGVGTNTVNAGRDIILFNDASNSRLTSAGGAINLTAQRNLTANVQGSTFSTIDSTQVGAAPAGANVTLTAVTGNIALGDGVQAGTAGTVTLTAGGAISDLNGAAANIAGLRLAMTAATGIASNADPLETAVGSLEAGTNTGGVFVANTGNLVIGGVSGALNGVRVATAGDISLVNTGSITITTNNEIIRGPGGVNVQAIGAAADITTGGNNLYSFFGGGGGAIEAGTGPLTVNSGRDLIVGSGAEGDVMGVNGVATFTVGRDLTSTGSLLGTIFNTFNVNAGGNILSTNSSFNTAGANQTIVATGSVTLIGNHPLINVAADSTVGGVAGQISFSGTSITLTGAVINTLDATNGAVFLTATTGAITDTTPADGLLVQGGALTATAVTGITLETSVDSITATTSGAGNISIGELTGVTLTNVNAANGNVTVAAGGAMIATSVTAGGAGDMILSVTGGGIAVGVLDAAGDMIELSAPGGITDGDAANDVTAADLLIVATGGIASLADPLETTVSQLAVQNSGSGDIGITNTGALNLTTLTGTLLGTLSSVSNPAGAITIVALSPIAVNIPVSAAVAVVLTATDSAAAGDDLTISASVTSTGSSVTLNAGDNAGVTANLSAATTLAINIDAGDLDPATGATLNIAAAVVITATSATFTGATQADAFNFLPQATTPINVFGLAPVANPGGDTMLLDTSAATNPTLNILGGQGAGLYTFGNRASVQYSSIENAATTTPINVALDATATGVDNIRLQRSAGPDFEVYNSNTNALMYAGPMANVLSFLFLGSANANTVTIDDVNGLVDLAGTVPAPTGVGNNGNVAGVPEIFLRGAGGTDAVVFANTLNNTNQTYGLGTGTGPGSQAGEVLTTNGVNSLSVYFDGMEGVASNDATPGDTGTLTIVGDLNANNLSTAAVGGGTAVNVTGGYVPFTFAPQAFNAFTVNAGDGNDSITIDSLNPGETSLAISLNGENNDDTISVGATPAAGTLSMQGGVGNDAYQLGGPANLVDNILIPVTISDPSGTDSLTVNDSSDLTGDTVTITATTIDGINGASSPNITYGGIESLDVTTSGGADTITTTLAGPNNLATVNVRGAGGDDDFFLSLADGLASPTTLNLVGDAGSDDFGSAMAPMRPTIGPATNVFVYGDSTAITTNPGGAITDHLFLDMATSGGGTTVQPLVIVDTVSGTATATNTRTFRFGGIDDIDLYNGTELTDVQIGDIYMLGSSASERFVLYRDSAGMMLKYNGMASPLGPFNPAVTNGRMVVYGGAGNDYMEFNFTLGGSGVSFNGGADNDTLVGGLGNDTLAGGAGNDTLRGGEGNDLLFGEDAPSSASPIPTATQRATGLVFSASAGNDSVDGGGGNDFVFGGGGDDNLIGGLGDDYVHGGDGNDTLNSMGGNDILRGEAGADTINGDTGADIIVGGTGDDKIFGRGGRDFQLAGAGADQIQDTNDGGEDVTVTGILALDADAGWTLPGSSWTGLSDNDLALQALMFSGVNAWNAAMPFATRVGALTALTAMTNDGAADIVLGSLASQDYLISNTADMRLNTTGDTMLTL